ncbi:hypothetical protein O1611_g2090 [Lasiodiplodia mahajangana]|uniref:Uncharacterized protein n=1 Tax=Lasiodiplodia mahajangana TaxID=1108764 RepID=A0ACC2JVJ1_9PEZI|nr:hypothetical protein O1611_g2090 [Lasiodiplodia mahajangana]
MPTSSSKGGDHDTAADVDGGETRWLLESIEFPGGEKTGPPYDYLSTSDNWTVEALDSLSSEYYGYTSKPRPTSFLESEIDQHITLGIGTATRLETLLQSVGGADGGNQLDIMRRKDANYITGRTKANQTDLRILEAHARMVDPVFADLLRSQVGHSYSNVRSDGKAVIGDEYADGWQGGPIGPSNTYVDVYVSSGGVAVLGNKYGGKSIFDSVKPKEGS